MSTQDDYRYIYELLLQHRDRYTFMLKYRKSWSPTKISQYRESLYILKKEILKQMESLDC